MTDTERIAHRVYDRYTTLHECAMVDCLNLCAGSRYCERCLEEINGEPYSLRNLLLEKPGMFPTWKHLRLWPVAALLFVAALCILL